MKNISTKKLTTLAMFSAMAVVLCLLIRVPLVPAVSFLTYDPKDVVIGIAGFLFGPLSAFVISVVASVLELLFHGGNIIDVIMNVLSTCSFVCVAAVIYKKMHTRKGAFIGLLAGVLTSIVVMVIWNYAVDPFYFGMPTEAVVPLLPAIALFNLLKQGINAALILLIYKPVVGALRSSGLVEKTEDHVSKSHLAAVVGLFILITIAVVAFTLNTAA